jgi:hypothetical protein
MDHPGLFVFNLSKFIHACISETDQERDGEHRQNEDEIIDDQIDISSEIEVFALGAEES